MVLYICDNHSFICIWITLLLFFFPPSLVLVLNKLILNTNFNNNNFNIQTLNRKNNFLKYYINMKIAKK